MTTKFLNRSFIKRIFGRPATQKPLDPQCWSFSDGKITIDLNRATELKEARWCFEAGERRIAPTRVGNPWR